MRSSGTAMFYSCVFALRVLEQTAEGSWLALAGRVGQLEAFMIRALNISLLSSVLWVTCGVQTRSGFIAVTYKSLP